MTFDEILEQVITLLKRQGRVSYSALRRRFDLDDAYLEDLKDELLFSHPVVDEAGRGLVWTGETETSQEVASPSAQPTPQSTAHETQPPDEPQTEPRSREAERRQLTVMFCDLVDSTKLSSQLDAEDYREVVRAYQSACTEVIQRYDGHIAQYLGDGLLVYFGYPIAHEEDAQRAVYTGLGIIQTIQTLNSRLEQEKSIRLAVRLGIHTGLVVVGEMGGAGRQEQLALGEVPNVASRIQGVAHPNTVVMSADTYRLVQGFFECEPLGEQDLRGVSQPIAVYRVLRESGAQSRLDVASTARAREVCHQIGETPQLFPVLHALWRFYMNRAEFQTTRVLGEQLLRLAQRLQAPALLLESHRALGATMYWLGAFVDAREHLQQGIVFYDPHQHRAHAFLYGQEPRVACRCFTAWVLWLLGYPDQARQHMHETLILTQALSHPFSVAYALSFATIVHQFRREGAVVQDRAEALLALANEQGFPHWLAYGMILRGWALTTPRRGDEGIAHIHQGLETYRATGAKTHRPYFLALLAETYGMLDQPAEGLTVLTEALTMVENTDERNWEAELHHLKGQLLTMPLKLKPASTKPLKSPKTSKPNR